MSGSILMGNESEHVPHFAYEDLRECSSRLGGAAAAG
jgi:hypothetical protein